MIDSVLTDNETLGFLIYWKPEKSSTGEQTTVKILKIKR